MSIIGKLMYIQISSQLSAQNGQLRDAVPFCLLVEYTLEAFYWL